MSSSDNNIPAPPPPPPPPPLLDIQIEIMKRLPVKPLLKFKSVSRKWKSIIHSSTFVSDYNNLNSTRRRDHMLLACYYQDNVCVIQAEDDDDDDEDDGLPKRHMSTLTFPSYRQPSRSTCTQRIIGFSQGLLAFSSDGTFIDRDSDYKDNVVVVIWNPSIRKCVTIPVPNILWTSLDDPVFGFGVVSNNATEDDDPVIVRINFKVTASYRRSEPSLVEVFKLSTGAWRTLSSDCLPCTSLDLNSDSSVTTETVAIDRFIYWHVSDRGVDGRRRLNLILSFNMICEDFTEIQLPDSLAHKGDRYDLYLSKLRESLVVLESNLVEEKQEYDVWIMEEHGVFKKIYTIKAPNASIKTVFGFRKNGQAIVRMLNDPDKRTSVFVYEPGSQRFTDSGIPAYGSPRFASSYKRTLLLLNHLDKYKMEKHTLQPYMSKKKEKVEEYNDDDLGFSLFD